MSFKVSPIFRAGNQVADALANYGAINSSFSWWDSCPTLISFFCLRDWLGMSNYRFI